MATQGSSVRFSGNSSTANFPIPTANAATDDRCADVGTSVKWDLFINQTGASAAALTAYVGDATGEANKVDADEAQLVANAALAQLESYLGSTNYGKLNRITIRCEMET